MVSIYCIGRNKVCAARGFVLFYSFLSLFLLFLSLFLIFMFFLIFSISHSQSPSEHALISIYVSGSPILYAHKSATGTKASIYLLNEHSNDESTKSTDQTESNVMDYCYKLLVVIAALLKYITKNADTRKQS